LRLEEESDQRHCDEANVMFAGPALSLVVLPLMIFHQIQLMACAALARRYASEPASASEPPGLRRPAGREREIAGAQDRFIVAANRGRSA
jgi:hypothetical protein